MKNIIFTDLDGTLLDHHNYSFEESSEALNKILAQKIPLIFTTSKTKIEVELLQKELNIKEPFIIENGAALFIPQNYQGMDLSFLDDFDDEYKVMILGKTYRQILNFYEEYKVEFSMVGFSDMTDFEVTKLTSLELAQAKLARKREFTEPFIFQDGDESKLEKLQNLASTYKIKVTKGGRFYHLIGEKQDKGIAVERTIKLFETLYGQKLYSIALGDGQNDIPMLKNVNLPIVIQNHQGEYLSLDLPNLEKSSFQGSKGWNEMILKCLK
jgi:mannosyl-3-phosphoglycerate phosphatase